jgi:hypothetical protein
MTISEAFEFIDSMDPNTEPPRCPLCGDVNRTDGETCHKTQCQRIAEESPDIVRVNRTLRHAGY